jgi:hypothetical protein
MVDLSLSNPISPMLFSLDGYRLVVMPMLTDKAKEWQKANQAESKAKPVAEPTEKPKRKQKAKEPVAVA